MSEVAAGAAYIERLIGRIGGAIELEEQRNGAEPRLLLRHPETGAGAGFLRLWAAADGSLADRLVHCRLQSDPVETHLLFLFGRSDTSMPHFHAQVVQFGADAFVYNADVIPRLDAVDHPDYITRVYGPLTKTYWSVISRRENVASFAPANPAVAIYLSPWGIAASRPTDRAELERTEPAVQAYLDHVLALARTDDLPGADPALLSARDARHMALLQSETLDPRAWKGVYRIAGEAAGREIRKILATPLRSRRRRQ